MWQNHLSCFPCIIQDSHLYRSTITQVVLKSLILVSMEIVVFLQISSSFQKDRPCKCFSPGYVTDAMLEAIKDPRYLKLDTWLIGCSYTPNGGRGKQFDGHILSFRDTDDKACSFETAVLVSCLCVFRIDDSSTPSKTRSFRGNFKIQPPVDRRFRLVPSGCHYLEQSQPEPDRTAS